MRSDANLLAGMMEVQTDRGPELRRIESTGVVHDPLTGKDHRGLSHPELRDDETAFHFLDGTVKVVRTVWE